jgi:hypothetical protein
MLKLPFVSLLDPCNLRLSNISCVFVRQKVFVVIVVEPPKVIVRCFGRPGRGGAGDRGVGVGVTTIEGADEAKATEGAGVLFEESAGVAVGILERVEY